MTPSRRPKPHTFPHTEERADRTRQSNSDAGLVARARIVLLGLSLVSEGKVSAISTDPVHGGEPDYTPHGERSLHDFHRRWIERANDEAQLLAAVKAAEEALRIATGGIARQRTSRSWDLFIVERYEGWTTAEVAHAENCHRTQVWRAREKHRRNGRDGRPRQARAAA